MILVNGVWLRLALTCLTFQQLAEASPAPVRSTSGDSASGLDDDVMAILEPADKATDAVVDLRRHDDHAKRSTSLAEIMNIARRLLMLEDAENLDGKELETRARVFLYGQPDGVRRRGPEASLVRRPDIRSTGFGTRLEPEDKYQQEQRVMMKAMRYGR